ncbi:MAG TPA: DNA polymerase III subunit gamma/tau, partial [Dysgonamonadaceae bacterium]|nr:DNA polymerase III subunit gamma/tau [Dysgonamonadaceae bacterium]
PSEEKEPNTASKNIPPKKEAPLKKRTVSINEMGISISELKNENKKENTSELNNKKNGSKPFTEENLINAWKAYADALTEEKLLKNTMSLYLPKLLADTLFEVEVNTEINKQYLEDNSASILAYLREKLQNDDVTMTIKIAEGNAIKKPLTSREIFDEMVKQNSSLQKLSDEFGLELS